MAMASEGSVPQSLRQRQARRRVRGSRGLGARCAVVTVGVAAGCLLLLRLEPALATRPAEEAGEREQPRSSSLRREEKGQEPPPPLPLSALGWGEWTREWGQMVRELRDVYWEGQKGEAGAEADVGFGGRVESMRSAVAEAFNSMSETPDRFFPFCPFVGAFDRLQLTCPVVTVAGQLLIRGPPEFDRVTKEYPFPPDPGRHGRTYRRTDGQADDKGCMHL